MPKITDLPPFVSTAALAGLTGFSPQWIGQLSAAGKIPQPEADGFPLKATIQAIVKDLRTRGGTSEQMAAAKLRKMEAEATNAELRTKEAAEVLVNEANMIVKEFATRVRVTTQTARYLTNEQQLKLLKAFRELANDDAPEPKPTK